MASETMTTVVGVFKDYPTAQTVAQELKALDFPSQDVHVRSGTAEGIDASSQGEPSSRESGIARFFRNLFDPDDDSQTRYYEDAVRSGKSMVLVDTEESRSDYAVEVMNRHGALDIEQDAFSVRLAETLDRAMRSGQIIGEDLQVGQGERSIPVMKEELTVGKRAVQRGGVRIYSRVVDSPVEEQVTLREEHVRVERRPANRPVSAADMANLRDQTIEVTEMAEEPVVSKRARVVEEISVAKETRERKETVHETLRRTEVTVEKVGKEAATPSVPDYDETDFRDDFERRYAGAGMPYESVAPAYEYGYTMAGDPRYRGKAWEDVESTLETDYLRNSPNSTWDNIKGAVRYGWEKVTGKRRSAR